MAFRVLRQRKEARRNAKLNEIFEDRDLEDIDKITLDQLIDIFRIYEVDLDVEAAQSITDSAGFITKEDFMKFAKDRNLVDFNDRKDKDDTPKKEWAPQNKSSKQSSTGLLCCCGGTVSPEPGPDRVELAFKRMDKNKDGFITWDEFNKNTSHLSPDQAKRIFRSCDKDGDHKITLQEFKTMANSQAAA